MTMNAWRRSLVCLRDNYYRAWFPVEYGPWE